MDSDLLHLREEAKRVEFTYTAYAGLVAALQAGGYRFVNYANEQSASRAVIMRHDVDLSLAKALELARLEHKLGVTSTYFVLVATNFYNMFSLESYGVLREMLDLGHEVGLHFDEMRYKSTSVTELVDAALLEADMLGKAIGKAVTAVSMHRPSRLLLDADVNFGCLTNSYSQRFFREYKYLSDSRMHWREDVLAIVNSGAHERLHILTHPFWYGQSSSSMAEKLQSFVSQASVERYASLDANFTALGDVLSSQVGV